MSQSLMRTDVSRRRADSAKLIKYLESNCKKLFWNSTSTCMTTEEKPHE